MQRSHVSSRWVCCLCLASGGTSLSGLVRWYHWVLSVPSVWSHWVQDVLWSFRSLSSLAMPFLVPMISGIIECCGLLLRWSGGRILFSFKALLHMSVKGRSEFLPNTEVNCSFGIVALPSFGVYMWSFLSLKGAMPVVSAFSASYKSTFSCLLLVCPLLRSVLRWILHIASVLAWVALCPDA